MTTDTQTPTLRYIPGGDADALSRRLGRAVIKLASNENPLGPPLGAQAAIHDAAGRAQIYPEPTSESLRAALAERHGLTPEEVLVCAGGTDAIQIAAMLTAVERPGAAVIAPHRSFLAYRVAANQVGLRAVDVPLIGERLDLGAMLAAAQDPAVGLLYLANPNNPTGTSIDPKMLTRFLARVPERVLVVLDEAYIEFLAPERRVDAAALVRRHANVVVLRTFSKVYGLAALRIGYVLGAAATIARLGRFVMPFRVSAAAQKAARAALEDELFVIRSHVHNRRQRTILTRGLMAMGLEATASDANFVLVDLGRPAAPIAAALEGRGIMVRTLEPYGMTTALRISVGLADENRAVLDALAELLGVAAGDDAVAS
ncbi:MAG: histidinol-phosphate transaminase [Myxococcales bacterium]|nr:histidinol-phosphate transaminase [Myxococcales bacterium]